MRISESCSFYSRLKNKISRDDVRIIIGICKELCLPQKTLSFSCFSFFAAKEEIRIEPDDVILVTAAINLACRACETGRSVEKILHMAAREYSIEIDSNTIEMYLKSVNRTEMDISMGIDFNFQVTEIYSELERFCKQQKLDPIISKKCWILLNDIMATPLCVFFMPLEMICSVVFLSYATAICDELDTGASDYQVFLKIFYEKIVFKPAYWPAIKFISGEILEIYDSELV